jgi:serine/threonine protein kinase
VNDPSAAADSKDPRIESALREYLEQVDRGEAPDLEAFIAQHPGIADELRSFIVAEERFRRMAGADPVRETAGHSAESFSLHGQETIAPPSTGLQSADSGVSGLTGQFGRYRIVRALGHGAMGTVYLAEDTQLLRQVALKTPHFALAPAPEVLERFYREARAAATLRHPNICPVYDVGQIDGTHYISMAYIEGHPLSAFIQSGKPQPERQVLIVVRKLAQALADAHEHGIVHRDLKPANIMVDKRNEPIIMDFGLAQQVKRDTNIRLTQSGTLIGTPAYMSPEQVDGEPDKIGPPTDQYSLGVILYELLTGQLPFRGSIAAVLGQIVMKDATPPSQLRPGLDPRIEVACLKMMAKQSPDRFASMSAVVAELETILRNPARPKAEDTGEPATEQNRAPSGSPALGERPLEPKTRSAGVPPSQAPKPLSKKDLASLEELARKCLARHDYDQVIQIIERIPDEQRNAGAQALLEECREKTDEIAFLLCEIDDAVRVKDRPAALRKVEELLKIKPGHLRAREIQEKFAAYGEAGGARLNRMWQFTRPWNEGGWVPWSALAFGLAVFAVMTGVVVLYVGSNRKNRNTAGADSSVVAKPEATDRKVKQLAAVPANNVAKAPPRPNPSAKVPNAGQVDVPAARAKAEPQIPMPTAALIDVLPKLDLIRACLKGEWQRAVDGGVVPSGSPPFCSLQVPVNLSEAYRLELEFTVRRRANENGIFLHVPVGGRYCRVAVLNDWIELSRVAGEERRLPPPAALPDSRPILRNGKKIGRYKTTTQEYGFGTFRDGSDIIVAFNQRYRLSVDVRTKENDATIAASLNGRLALDWTGSIASLSEPNDGNIWVGRKRSGLAFGTEDHVDVEFHALRIQSLGGARNREEADQSETTAANQNQGPLGSIASVTGRQASTKLPAGGHGLKATYFRGANFEERVLERIDPQIDFFWIRDAPDPAVPKDHFSVRWEGWLKAPAPGDYRVQIVSDDGVRLWLDGNRLVDDWHSHLANSHIVNVRMTDKPSQLRVEYFQDDHTALVTLLWSHLPQTGQARETYFGMLRVGGESLFLTKAAAEEAVVPMPTYLKGSQGLRIDLYRDKEMKRKIATPTGAAAVVTAGVDFVARNSASVPAIRCSGWLKPPTTGRYRLIVSYSDGLRLWMGGTQFINDWHPNSYPRQDEFEADFASLEPMSFRVEHFDEKNSSGVCSVRWIPPGAKLPEIIPIEAWSLTGR